MFSTATLTVHRIIRSMKRLGLLGFALVVCACVPVGCGSSGPKLSADRCSTATPTGAFSEKFHLTAPTGGSVSAAENDTTARMLCVRAQALGIVHPVIRQQGNEQIELLLPGDSTAQVAAQITRRAALYFYDWEPNVIANPAKPNVPAGESTFRLLYDAVRRAAQRTPECFENTCTTAGPEHYLFNSRTHRWVAGPADSQSALFAGLPGGKQPTGTVVLGVPQGTLVVQKEGIEGHERTTDTNDPLTEWFVIRDRPSLSAADITDPKASTDQFNQPDVVFNFTPAGRQKFMAMTRAIAQRGRAHAPPSAHGNALLADTFAGHFAIVVNQQVKSRPIINFVDNPNGNDGRLGAEINGFADAGQARDLADLLKVAPELPVALSPTDR